jgi:hypothetical protein
MRGEWVGVLIPIGTEGHADDTRQGSLPLIPGVLHRLNIGEGRRMASPHRG